MKEGGYNVKDIISYFWNILEKSAPMPKKPIAKKEVRSMINKAMKDVKKWDIKQDKRALKSSNKKCK